LAIKSVTVIPENLELTEAYSISLSTQYQANYVLVLILDDEDHVGIGEASPMPVYSDETQESIMNCINKFLAPAVAGMDEYGILRIIDVMDLHLQNSLMAKSAIEIATYDLASKKANQSLVKFLGGSVRDSIGIAGSIGFMPTQKAAEKAKKLVGDGVVTIKIKIGRTLEEDSELVRSVRNAIGNDPKIRLDANQAYDPETAISKLKELERFDPELFEQPVKSNNLESMADIARSLDTPIMADEPIISQADVIRFAEAEAADLIKLKVNRCGGIRKTIMMSELARSYGLKVIVGSGHESSIGVAAEAAVALTCTNVDPTGEMNGNQRLTSEFTQNRLLPRNGKITAWESPGLGLKLKDNFS
jgi:L-Ala-D/L-Glu epimerase